MNKIGFKKICKICLALICLFSLYHTNIKATTDELFDYRGFDKQGMHRITKTQFDQYGYDVNFFNKEGYTITGFDKNFIHKDTKTKYSSDNYDIA